MPHTALRAFDSECISAALDVRKRITIERTQKKRHPVSDAFQTS